MTDLDNYILPDKELMLEGTPAGYKIWRPSKTWVVLGASNKVDSSVFLENTIRDKVKVVKRPSGGESVVLSPKTICVSASIKRDNQLSPKKYFGIFNSWIVDALFEMGVNNLNFRGISDISIGEKKILGSAIYQNREKVIYQAVLNVSESPDNFETYLKHPKREPDYRKNRQHKEFVTSILKEGYDFNINLLQETLEKLFEKSFPYIN